MAKMAMAQVNAYEIACKAFIQNPVSIMDDSKNGLRNCKRVWRSLKKLATAEDKENAGMMTNVDEFLSLFDDILERHGMYMVDNGALCVPFLRTA